MELQLRPLTIDPAALNGLSQRLVSSHYDNNYTGAVKRMNAIRQQLFTLGDDVRFIPGHGPMSTMGQERATNPFVADHRFG